MELKEHASLPPEFLAAYSSLRKRI